jgi:hypothetical protein
LSSSGRFSSESSFVILDFVFFVSLAIDKCTPTARPEFTSIMRVIPIHRDLRYLETPLIIDAKSDSDCRSLP